MKQEFIFPRAEYATPLQKLCLVMDREWPSIGAEKAEIERAIARHIYGDRTQAAADRFEDDLSRRLGDLADDLREADAALDWGSK